MTRKWGAWSRLGRFAGWTCSHGPDLSQTLPFERLNQCHDFWSEEDVFDACVEDIADYTLPDDPSTIVRVRSVSAHRMKQYRGGSYERRKHRQKAQAELFADSILKEDGEPLFGTHESSTKQWQMRTRRYASLLQSFLQHNGANDEVRNAEAEAEQEKSPTAEMAF